MRLATFAVSAIFMSSGSSVAVTPTLYKCDILSSVYALGGTFHEQHKDYMRLMTPLTIDVVSGIVRMGEKNRVTRWRVVQEHDPKFNLDWILKKAKGGSPWWDRADDVMRIRFSEGAVYVVHYFSSNLLSGTCKTLD